MGVAAVLGLAAPAVWAAEPEFTVDFDVERCKFAQRRDNPLFQMNPGERPEVEGWGDGERSGSRSRHRRHQGLLHHADGAAVDVRAGWWK